MQTFCGTVFAGSPLYRFFNISSQTLARFLLCVCARENVSRGTQHQELIKVKTKIICALMLVCYKKVVSLQCDDKTSDNN